MQELFKLISWQMLLIDKLYIDERQRGRNHHQLLQAVPRSVCVEIPKRSAGSHSNRKGVYFFRLVFFSFFHFLGLETHPNMPYGLFALRSIHIQYFSRNRLMLLSVLYGLQLPERACVSVYVFSFISSIVFRTANLL